MEKKFTYLKTKWPVAMKNTLRDSKKMSLTASYWLVSLATTLKLESKKSAFRVNPLRLDRKAKVLITVVIVALLLISAFEFLPKQVDISGSGVPQNNDNSTATPTPSAKELQTPSPTSDSQANGSSYNSNQFLNSFYGNYKAPGLIEPGQSITNATWMAVASDAWSYFQPGEGIDSGTGLPYAGSTGFTSFTDWDLGCYIQAAIDAQQIGLINSSDNWSFSARMNDVITFLENRQLNNASYPYQFYDATTGNFSAMSTPETVDTIDTGRLFVALNNLLNFNSSLKGPIDNIVLNGRSNYTALLPSIQSMASQNSIYAYYVASGFASFWPNQLSTVPSTILDNIYSSGNVTTYGVSLPDAPLLGDPLLCSVFELNNNSTQLMALSREVYLASEANYNATGQFVAFGEGNGPDGQYLWEWVVAGNDNTWQIVTSGGGSFSGNPIVYTKIAFSFLALYNTTYAINMVAFLEQSIPSPTSAGYFDGADNSGILVADLGSNTNSLILDAAQYAIKNNSTS